MPRPKVILRRCESYDVDRIADIIRTSIEELNLDIRGKVFVKPNIVTANRRYIHNSFTHPAVVEAMVRVLGGQPVDDAGYRKLLDLGQDGAGVEAADIQQ